MARNHWLTLGLTALLAIGAGALVQAAPALATDELAKIITEAKAPARFADHKANFSFGKETFSFKNGAEKTEFYTIKDGDKYIAVLHPGMIQLDMITFDPTKGVDKPGFKDYYSWGTLLGTRITVNCWAGGMGPTGKVSFDFKTTGSTLTLTTQQVWAGTKGVCDYVMTLSCDPVLGYVWNATTAYASDKPPTKVVKDKQGNESTKLETIEFFNWQVPVTAWTSRNNNPRWPAGWTHARKVFFRPDNKIVGFWLNPDSVDYCKYKRSDVKEGGFVAKLPGPDGWGVGLVHVQKAPYSTNNATCNMWADSHNLLKLPDQPDADGVYRAKAVWRFQAIPPEGVQAIMKVAEMDNIGKDKYCKDAP